MLKSLENYTANAGQTFNVTYILSLFIMIGQHGGSFIFFWLSSVWNTNIPLQIASLFECHYVFPLFVECFNHFFQICNQGINMSGWLWHLCRCASICSRNSSLFDWFKCAKRQKKILEPNRYHRLEENGKAHMVKGSALETNKIDQVVISYSSHKDTLSFRKLIIEIVDCFFCYT